MANMEAVKNNSHEDKTTEKWNALGRKIGELTKGDIVFYVPMGFGEVVLSKDNLATVEFVVKGKATQKELLIQSIELITPAEYRFDR